jgi:Tol biopolymer transport system component
MQFKRALWLVPFVTSLSLTSFFYAEVRSEDVGCKEDDLVVTYVSEEVDRSDIYIVREKNMVKINLTYSESHNINPSWSPDGVDMVFQSDRDGNWEIYGFADGNSANLTQNAADDTNPVWSPDGSRIAFGSNRGGNWQIYTYQDNKITQVTSGTSDNRFPVWSPDGTQIAFYSTPIGHQISLLDLTTGTTKTIIDMPAIGQFSWSPDGTQIAFTSGADENSNKDIYLLTVDTGEIVKLTDNSFGAVDPRWSPDGSKILFWGGTGEKAQIFVMDRDGQNIKNLSSNDFNDRSATWSPTGASIAFESTRETTPSEIVNSLYRMSPDGTNVLKLADHVAHFSNLWRPCKLKQ